MDTSQALEQLDSPYRDDRIEAVRLLGKHKYAPAIPRLAAMLERGENQSLTEEMDHAPVKKAIVRVLTEIGDPAAVPVLLTALRTRPTFIEDELEKALLEFEHPAILPGVIEALHVEEPAARITAARVLAAMQDPRTVEPLLGALFDSNVNVVLPAAKGLLAHGDPRVEEGILRALREGGSATRDGICTTLARQGGDFSFAIPTLLQALPQENNRKTRIAIVQALGKSGAPSVVPALGQLLGDEDEYLVTHALRALAENELPEARATLQARYDERHDPKVFFHLLHSLSRSKDPEGIRLIEAALRQEDPQFHNHAARHVLAWGRAAVSVVRDMLAGPLHPSDKRTLIKLIGASEDPIWLPLLLDVLRDPQHSLRSVWRTPPVKDLSEALAAMGEPAAEELINLLATEDSYALETALDALVRMGSPKAIPPLLALLRAGKAYAAASLAAIENEAAQNGLLRVLEGEELGEELREAARKALHQMGAGQAAEATAYAQQRSLRREVLMRPGWERRQLTWEDVEKILAQRAEIYYETLQSAGAFQEALDPEAYHAMMAPILSQQAQAFVLDQVGDGFKSLNHLFIELLPEKMESRLERWLPQSRDAWFEVFNLHALSFYKALQRAGGFVRPLGEETFRSKARAEILRGVERKLHHGGPADTLLLGLLGDCLKPFEDGLARLRYDYEDGYDGFFERLGAALKKVSIPIDVSYDASSLRYTVEIGAHRLTLEGVRANDDLLEPFISLDAKLKTHLADLGWSFFEIPTGDQTADMLLVPRTSQETLRAYLPDFEDRRIQLFCGIDGRFHHL